MTNKDIEETLKLDELKFVTFDDEGYKVYTCPICGGEVKVHDSVFYGKCTSCMVTVIDYKPSPHQMDFHRSKAQYRLNIGGFGSGKTTSGAAEIGNHALSVPNGKTLITAQSLQQVKEAVLPELEKFLPPWFFAKKPIKSPLPKYILKNGHQIVVYPSNDEEKIRSLNLTAFWIVEASGIDLKIFEQLQTRLRNKAAVVKDHNGMEIEHRFIGIIESNPEFGWIRDEFLLRSSIIKASKSVDISSYDKLKTKKPEKAYHSFLTSSVDNPYLHKNFISNMCVGKTDKWIRKYIYSYLESREGVVYPDFSKSVVAPFPIPDNWQRIYGFDKGWSDATTLVCGAISPIDGVCYVYDEYYVNQKPITYHAHQIKEKIAGFPMYRGIQADPSVRNASDKDGVSYRDYFMNVSGIDLQPANNSILDGIERVRDFMYRDKLKFFTNCIHIKEEAQAYVWKTDKNGIGSDMPVDRSNHLMDALRYMIMGLPMDLKTIYAGRQSSFGKDTILDRLQPDTDIDDLISTKFNGSGGIYMMNKI
jgi:phage terminase large subunit